MGNNVFTRNLGQPVDQKTQETPNQVRNNAGGFVFEVTDAARLRRFLHLGTEGGSYYESEAKLTKDSAAFLIGYIARAEQEVIDTVREVSLAGTAYRNSPAIFTVAMLFTHGKIKPRSLVQDVCRTSTHLFEFAEYVELLGGWGPAKRKAVAEWYRNKTSDQLAYQVVKYRQRNGWTHRDLFRLAHPMGSFSPGIGEFILGRDQAPAAGSDSHEMIRLFKFAQEAETVSELLNTAYFVDSPLPWEAAPTKFHNEVRFWKRLFDNGQLKGQALLRNVTRLAKLNAFDDMVFAYEFAGALKDEYMLRKTRLHPFQYLLALKMYEKTGNTNSVIMAALNEGFYLAFKYVEPANKRTMIALDVSPSMGNATMKLGITAAELGAVTAMTIARTEPFYQINGFTHQFRTLPINPSMSLPDIMRVVRDGNGWEGTDCAIPMLYATKNNIAVDTFIIITDNETHSGYIHPGTALKNYRKHMNIPAKLIVIGATATRFSIADPKDAGMLDVAGGDSSLPALIANFSAGRF